MTNSSIGLIRGIAPLALLALSNPVQAATATTSDFGKMPNGEAVKEVKLTGNNGVSVVLITLGATIQAFNVPDKNGHVADITVGYDKVSSYIDAPNYWGQTIGRYANRIANGSFKLDGKTYQLTQNDGTNSLHGGKEGFDKRNWKLASVKTNPDGTVSATMTLRSPDGDQGYPGNLDVTVVYTLDDSGSLTMQYSATTDQPTIVNLTNHALFNLGGNGWPYGTYDEKLTIPASRYTPINDKLIPTGELRAVDGTVFDFRNGRMLYDGVRDGSDEQIVLAHGWDHNFVLDKGHTDKPELAARLEHAQSGRVLEVLTTAPGLQFYSGNFLDGTLLGKGNVVYRMGDAVALEAQLFPDTPNQPNFGSAELDPGQTYHRTIIYRVSTQD
ncbi:aldose epimerase family protein [Tsuneonella mangrovi]|uniref:aldose epimerase family protein n=1 Tax=Tsuneonella mangrovi TaxID=1982042 RepID=UPI000BA27D90|nr:aldose epimerase family protein [Tsuneonella mangrovi]